MDYQGILAKCFVAMSEVDHDLRRWQGHLNSISYIIEMYTPLSPYRRSNEQDQRGSQATRSLG